MTKSTMRRRLNLMPSFTVRLGVLVAGASGAIVRRRSGMRAVVGRDGPTRSVAKRSSLRFRMVRRRYCSASIASSSPSTKGPTAMSTRSAVASSTSVAVTGASSSPPSVPRILNGLPPTERRM